LAAVVGIFSEPRQNGAAAAATAVAVDSAVSADSVECLRQPKKSTGPHTQTRNTNYKKKFNKIIHTPKIFFARVSPSG